MKTFLTTIAVVAAISFPAFGEGGDTHGSQTGEPLSDSLKASDPKMPDLRLQQPGARSMGSAVTTGSAINTDERFKEGSKGGNEDAGATGGAPGADTGGADSGSGSSGSASGGGER